MSNELALLNDINPLKVFVENGLDPIIEKIAKEVKAEHIDISTPEGRERCASVAYKVAKSKTALDAMGKKLTEDWQKQIKAINAERSRAWDKLEALQKEIRKPLTDWEEAEKSRTDKHEADIKALDDSAGETKYKWEHMPIEEMHHRLAQANAMASKDWQEFASRGKLATDEAIKAIKGAIAQREKYEADQAELERHRQEKAERQKREAEQAQKDREEKLKAEAAETARKQAEQAAADQKAQLEREKAEEKERADSAERLRKEGEERAAKEKKEAAERAERDKLAAVEAEKKRAADAKAAEDAATAKREANKKHNAKINGEALKMLMWVLTTQNNVGSDEAETLGKSIVTAIAKGQIPNVTINY